MEMWFAICFGSMQSYRRSRSPTGCIQGFSAMPSVPSVPTLSLASSGSSAGGIRIASSKRISFQMRHSCIEENMSDRIAFI